MKTATRISLFTATLMALLAFVLLRDLQLILAGAEWGLVARLLSAFLVVVTAFGVIQFVSYADHLLRSLYAYSGDPIAPHRSDGLLPRVAVFIPVYNEEPDVVEACARACTAFGFPVVRFFLLDDSRDEKLRVWMLDICRR